MMLLVQGPSFKSPQCWQADSIMAERLCAPWCSQTRPAVTGLLWCPLLGVHASFNIQNWNSNSLPISVLSDWSQAQGWPKQSVSHTCSADRVGKLRPREGMGIISRGTTLPSTSYNLSVNPACEKKGIAKADRASGMIGLHITLGKAGGIRGWYLSG